MSQKKFYEPLYRFISTGGEGLVLTFQGKALSFRTPTANDYQRCLAVSDRTLEQELFLLAVCLRRVAGFDVSTNDRYRLFKMLTSLPKFKQRVMPHFWHMVEVAQKTSEFFEAFCYSAVSRHLWSKWKASARFGFSIEGFQASELSDIHLQWISFNELEDLKEDLEDSWRRAFFQASSMNPKGVEKIQKEWDRKKEREQEHREKVIESAERGMKLETEDPDGVKSVETLRTEYRNWVDGVEDDHDRIVREYKERLNAYIRNGRKLVDKQRQGVEDMQSSLNSLSMNTPLKAYSDQEIESLMSANKRTMVSIDEGAEYDSAISQRYLGARETTKDQSSLMDQVAKRKLSTIER